MNADERGWTKDRWRSLQKRIALLIFDTDILYLCFAQMVKCDRPSNLHLNILLNWYSKVTNLEIEPLQGQPRTMRLDEAVEFAENPEPRCPCVLLLDTSGSMQGAPIDALNEGLEVFRNDLIKDELAKKRVEVAIISFDNQIKVVQDFVTADQFETPLLTAQGQTHMGAGIQLALDTIAARKSEYRNNGITYYRPWVFMITDGEPQGESDDVVEIAAQRIREEETNKRVAFFAVGVEGANIARLAEIVERTPVKLRGLDFREMFIWLSASMQRVSHSKIDEQVALPPPGWGTV